MSIEEYTAMKVMEECGEVIQAVSKGVVFGFQNVNPATNEINANELMKEFHKLEASIEVLTSVCRIKDFNKEEIDKIKVDEFKNLSKSFTEMVNREKLED